MTSTNIAHNSRYACQLDPVQPYISNAWLLAVAAKAAYRNQMAEIDPVLTRALPRVVALHSTFAHGLVAANETDIVVALRGTNHPQHLRDSLSWRQIEGYGGRVHRGFAAACDRIWTPLMAALHDMGFADKRLWLAGHSLGGAVATLAAARLTDGGIAPQLTCTFGAPRVFDRTAALGYRPVLYRFVNDEDLVPHYPIPSLRYDYRHAGTRVFLLKSGRIAQYDRPWEAAGRHFQRFLMSGIAGVAVFALRDHNMSSYLAKLQSQFPGTGR